MLKEAGGQHDEVFALWQISKNSEEGKILGERERWERYKPEGLEMREWQRILGYDVNNLEHMRLTDCITIALIDSQNKVYPGNFSREEKRILRKVAMVHDLPEAVKGDITFELKTDEDEIRELQIMRLILNKTNFSEEIDGDEREQIISVLKDKNSKLGRTFAIIEKIGYFRTAMVAWKKSEFDKFKEEGISENLMWITNNVLLNQIPGLVNNSDDFVLVKKMLDFYTSRISDAFEKMPMTIFDKYDPDLREKNRKKFETARNIWGNYLKNQN